LRIISLVPSLTELLIDLGLKSQIVGRTKFCIHPADIVKSIPKIGGTKNVKIDLVQSLNPDLVIANKEENTKEDVLALNAFTKVLVTDIPNYREALNAILRIGSLTATEQRAKSIVDSIENEFGKISRIQRPDASVCYLIWKAPFMTIGKDTYIHDMLTKCGFSNVFGDRTRYPVVTLDDIKNKKPNYIFLSSEPFPFNKKHVSVIQELCPESKTILVDGEAFSWYGSKMIQAGKYFHNLRKELDSL